MTAQLQSAGGSLGNDSEAIIDACLSVTKPTSFFLFAGAGSGKTRSLVRALEELRKRAGKELRLEGRQIAVITYTNAACDEIIRRMQFDSLFAVSTIHSFVWEQIKGFDKDIQSWLKASIGQELSELEVEQSKGRQGSQASIDRGEKIKFLYERRSNLDFIRRFIYSPTGDNRTKDSLNHSEVIKIGASFLVTKPLMQRLLVGRYPVLLIDESQDTNKALIDAFFSVQSAHSKSFCIGLFGDTMQRIYSDGKSDLGRALPDTWKRPARLVNYRSPKRVVTLINKIRSEVDEHQQEPAPNAKDGTVRFFIAKSEGTDRTQCEAAVRRRMATISEDAKWNDSTGVKALTLEHHMAAQRLGFSHMFSALDAVSDFGTGLRDGSLPMLAFFTKLILPLVVARLKGDKFAVAAIVRENSPLLSVEALTGPEADQAAQLNAAYNAVEGLGALFANSQQPTLHQVLSWVASTELFRVPQSLLPFTTGPVAGPLERNQEQPAEEMSETKTLEATRAFLSGLFAQIAPYAEYVKGESALATHQGVKGLEFPRVLVVMDDAEARGFMFKFEKLFGAEALTTTDLKNEREGKETGIDRTRRLFYVTCSRAQEGLALLAYSADTMAVRRTLIEQHWFVEGEIEIL